MDEEKSPERGKILSLAPSVVVQVNDCLKADFLEWVELRMRKDPETRDRYSAILEDVDRNDNYTDEAQEELLRFLLMSWGRFDQHLDGVYCWYEHGEPPY